MMREISLLIPPVPFSSEIILVIYEQGYIKHESQSKTYFPPRLLPSTHSLSSTYDVRTLEVQATYPCANQATVHYSMTALFPIKQLRHHYVFAQVAVIDKSEGLHFLEIIKSYPNSGVTLLAGAIILLMWSTLLTYGTYLLRTVTSRLVQSVF